MDRLDAMKVLVAAVDAGSLSGAARRLVMPLATVSRKVSELESSIGATLLVRSSRRLALTEAGQGYLAACRRILEQVSEAERAAAGEYIAPRGELNVTAPVVFGRLVLLPIVLEFLRAYSDIDLQLSLGDRPINLFEEHVDVALRIGELPDSNLIATQVGEVSEVTCASPAHLASHGLPLHPDELTVRPCILFSGRAASNRWRFLANGSPLFVEIKPRLTVNTAEAAIDAAAAGLGITRVLSYQFERACTPGELQLILAEYAPPAVPVSLLFSNQGALPLKLRAFLDFVKPRLRQQLRWNA